MDPSCIKTQPKYSYPLKLNKISLKILIMADQTLVYKKFLNRPITMRDSLHNRKKLIFDQFYIHTLWEINLMIWIVELDGYLLSIKFVDLFFYDNKWINRFENNFCLVWVINDFS